MIRAKIYKDIISTIDQHIRFDSTDFKIDFLDNSNILKIIYTFEPKYKITFKIPTSTTKPKDSYNEDYYFTGTVCPGPLSYEENINFTGEHGIYKYISGWLNCIWEELSASPVVKQVEDHQIQINEIYEKLETINDDHFTQSEANELKIRLDELEKSFKSEIEKAFEDKKALASKIDQLHTDIDTLKQTINSFSKKGWMKSFTGKIFKWTANAENRGMLKDGYSLIKGLMPEDIKNSLPE